VCSSDLYGISYNGAHAVEPEESTWGSETILSNLTEFNINTSSPNRYRALWTYRDQSNWPKAIRISFVIYDKGIAEEMHADGFKRYEVICPIGQ